MKPLDVGDTKDVVAVLSLDLDGLRWLCDELPQTDGMTRYLQRALTTVEERLRQENDDERFGIHIVMVPR